MSKIKEIAVIGAGASGMLAAIFASREAEKCRRKVKITIYEQNPRIGKKILVTGNGRCNFTNLSVNTSNFYGDTELFDSVYKRFNNEMTISFFEELGLYSKSDFAGRVYPLSAQASSVLDVLRYEIEKSGVRILCDTKITSVAKYNSGYILNGSYFADKIIFSAGGCASPVQGSDGSGIEILRGMGIDINSLVPALTPIVCSGFTKGLKGIRAQGKISIKCSGKELSNDCGEIQYTDYGLSGIPSMQVSAFVADAVRRKNSSVVAVVDSCPALSSDELKGFLCDLIEHNPSLPAEMLLAGLLPKKLGVSLLADCSVNPNLEIGKIHSAVLDKIVDAVKNKKYKVSDVKGFNDAQISSGGVSGREINPDTLELNKLKGIYICGEMIDVHGDCGGYNLQWAWSSGAVAGINSVREI